MLSPAELGSVEVPTNREMTAASNGFNRSPGTKGEAWGLREGIPPGAQLWSSCPAESCYCHLFVRSEFSEVTALTSDLLL